MRREQFSSTANAREVPVAAVWPQAYEAAVIAAAQDAKPDAAATPAMAAPDVPAAVGRIVVGSYVLLVGTLFAFMARSPLAAFSIGIAALFVIIYFAIPLLFLKVEGDPSRRPSFDRFMDEGMATLTGRTGGKDAIVQMVIVPVFLTFGLAAMGIAGLAFIP
jgi:hypothetical protein